MNIKAAPITPPVSVSQTQAQPKPAEVPAQPQPAEAAPEVNSKMGLLDYPKEAALAVTKMAAKGQAKNIVEFADDIQDIKTAGKDFVKDIKKGKVLSALGEVGKMGYNAVSANINAMQAGLAGLAGGVSAVVATPFVALDYGAEAVGKALDKKESGLVTGVGKVFQFLGGENSDKNVYDAVAEGQREGIETALKNRE